MMSAFAIVGIAKKIPILIFIGGVFMLTMFILPDILVMGFNSDKDEITTVYDLTSITGLYDVCGGAGCTHTIRGEYVANSASDLNGKEIDRVVYHIRKSGAPTGNIEFGIYDGTSNQANPIIRSLGTYDITLVPTTATIPITFNLDPSYTLQVGNVVGARFTGGSTGNMLRQNACDNDCFDSTNSIHRALAITTNVWGNIANSDIYMQMYRGSDLIFTNEPIEFEYTEMTKALFGLFGAILLPIGFVIYRET